MTVDAETINIPKASPKISIIIPVWNPGQGIRRCVDSLRCQTLEDIEMIFVDDCGTDGAMDVVRVAAANDSRIRIVTNAENMGAGASRNAAIELARGEYLSFVDADDYVSPDFLEILYMEGKTKDLDITKGLRQNEKEDGSVFHSSYRLNDVIRKGLEKKEPLCFLFGFEFPTALYHCRLFDNSDVRFGLTCIGEDTLFLLKACRAANSFGINDHAVYHYVYRKASATNAMTEYGFNGRISSLQCVVDYFVSHIEPNPYATLYLVRKLKNYLSFQRYASRVEGKEEASASFLADLQRIAWSYPALGTYKNDDFVIFALMEYGENLVVKYYQTSWEVVPPDYYVDVIDRRVGFLVKHPQYFYELKNTIAIANRFAVKMQSNGFSSEEIMAYQAQIKALLRRPPILRMRLKLFVLNKMKTKRCP